MIASVLAVGVLAKPNLVILYADDLGIGDLSCYGNRKYQTPNLDKMAAEGVRMTDFYVSSPACTPSRVSLLTGSYSVRVGLPSVINPDSAIGLNPSETTIADVAKSAGYRTAMFGKWHVGVKNLLPPAHGFDEFFGIPYSHDMWPPNGNWPKLYAYEGFDPQYEIKTLDQQAELTEKITNRTVDFIKRNRANPFMVYVPYHMPHVPLAVLPSSRGKSKHSLYGDVIYEIDQSVGRILTTLKSLKLDKQTMVMFASDNGPWIPYGDHGGSPGVFREGKGTTFEAGVRVPAIFWMPGTIPAGRTSSEITSTMDVLPTFAQMAGGALPAQTIDGHNIMPILAGEQDARSPWKWMYFYWPGELQAVRSGDWKLHVPHSHRQQTGALGKDGKSSGETVGRIGLSLFNLRDDPGETRNVADQNPRVVERMLRMVSIGRRELGDSLTKSVGSEVRSPGRVEN